MSKADRSRDAAARWFARAQDPDISAQERQALAEWLAASERHRAEYAALERIWGTAGAMDAARLRALAEPAGGAGMPAARRAAAGWPGRRGAWVAGTCALALAGGWLAWQSAVPEPGGRVPGAQVPAAYQAAFSTAPGERRTVRLPDGSRIQLNTRSRVAVHFQAGRRDVALLEGEAMFEVAHDGAQPFIVDAGAGSVTVTGTRFDVRRRTAGMEVAVESGSVDVRGHSDAPRKAGAAVRLTAGLGATVDGSGAVAPAAPVDLSAALAWRDGKLVFNDRPLSEVAAEVSRYRRQPVRVADAVAARLRVSSVFSADDPDALLAALPHFLPVAVRQLADGSAEIFSP